MEARRDGWPGKKGCIDFSDRNYYTKFRALHNFSDLPSFPKSQKYERQAQSEMSEQTTIQLTVVGLLKQYVSAPLPAPLPGQTISALIAELGIPNELVALVIVNRRQQLKSYVLKPGDVVKLAPFVGGGKRLTHG